MKLDSVGRTLLIQKNGEGIGYCVQNRQILYNFSFRQEQNRKHNLHDHSFSSLLQLAPGILVVATDHTFQRSSMREHMRQVIIRQRLAAHGLQWFATTARAALRP
jgi:hypothetical protein